MGKIKGDQILLAFYWCEMVAIPLIWLVYFVCAGVQQGLGQIGLTESSALGFLAHKKAAAMVLGNP